MAKVSVNSSQNKCCHLKCGNQACKGKERNVTCNPSGSVNKLGSCFRFLSDKATYLMLWKVISSCWNSGKSKEGIFAILQLLFKVLVESLFQFLELSNFICLAQEHAQSSSVPQSRPGVSKPPPSYRRISLCVEIQRASPLISRGFCEDAEFSWWENYIPHQSSPSTSQGITSSLLLSPAAQMEPHRGTLHIFNVFLQGEGFRYDQQLSKVWRLRTSLLY